MHVTGPCKNCKRIAKVKMKPLPDNWLAPFEPLPQFSETGWNWQMKPQPESMEPGSLFSKEADRQFEHQPAPDEAHDAWINDYDADGSDQ